MPGFVPHSPLMIVFSLKDPSAQSTGVPSWLVHLIWMPLLGSSDLEATAPCIPAPSLEGTPAPGSLLMMKSEFVTSC